MKQIILITGSNGFIGRHVCEYFRKKGCYVIGLGRREKSVPEVDEYLKIDLSEDEITNYKPQKNISAVIHLAADMRHEPDCVEVVRANCTGEQRLLEFCEKNSIDTFLQLSSLPVIGSPKILPIKEDHPICPPSVYHSTKFMGEILADYAMRKHGIRTASFRISAPVGVGMNEKTIFPIFVKKAVNQEDITVYGKGSREQTYIHVDDISQALFKALHSEKCKGVYNLASFNRISNLNLAKKCVEVLKSESKIVFNGLPDSSDGEIWDVCIDKLMADSGFKPEITIEDCIKEIANYFKK